MNVGQKIISGFLLAVLLVVIVGYFGIRTSNEAREGSIVEAEMSRLALKVAEKGTITFAATLTKDLDEFARLEEKANQLRDEIDSINSALLKDPNIKNSVDFQSFLAVKNDHDKDQEQVFRIHGELLARQTLFGDSPLVEEAVRQRLRAILDKTNDLELIKNFVSMEILSKEAVFQHRNKESVDKWIESIHKLRSDIEKKVRPDRILLNHFTVYLQTAEIVSEIVVRESEIQSDETKIVSAMRRREVELGTLRKKIVDELSANISRVHQNNKNILIMIIVGMLALMGGTSFFLSQRIIKPIEELTAVVTKIAGGDLKARARVFSTDEIGILARSFNQTADRLAEYPIELQQEVRRQTRELTDANTQLQELLHENYISAKMLVQRDRESVRSSAALTEINKEANETAKILVRRDLELTEANARLQELDVMKSDFVSVAAHQLRTPLTGIRWSYETLLEAEAEPLTAEQRKIVDGGHKAVLRLIELVGDLLNVARIEEGRFGFRLERQSIRPLLEEFASRFSKATADKGLHFTAELPAKDLPAVELDAERMGLALDNLLDNAVKYTPPGGTVRLRAAAAPKQLRITVSDTGIGIPSNQMHRLFTKFFRADNALLFQTTGSGLGLYVVKNIISSHDGTISIESHEGRGTTATISLPLPTKRIDLDLKTRSNN
ncbi:HAMP domain-containing protein [Candidatus Parcubacteria bacterium]|nr:HAMP domain-containing protein [Candidatus Parcubacteria bacterium]